MRGPPVSRALSADVGGEPAARAVARDREAAGVRAELARVLGEPFERRVRILETRRRRMLGREADSRQTRRRSRSMREPAAHRVVAVAAAAHISAAVVEDQQRKRPPLAPAGV